MRRAIVVSLLLTMLLLAHCTTPKRPLAPRDSPVDASLENFSGTYCFVSMKESFREYNGLEGLFLPRGLPDRSLVSVTHDDDRISVEYAGAAGANSQRTWSTAESEWRRGKMIVPLPTGGNPFGAYYSRSWLTVYRLQDGRLVLQHNRADTGLTCLLIPSHDKRETMIILAPRARCGTES